MGQIVFSDPLINWVAGAMLLGIVAALALARDAHKRSRASKPRDHVMPAQAGAQKQA
ncbi:MAG: hypothetical protein HYX47_12970 [Burkholderiales bacterium]|nr:hypothetical protein [Burkholderiales bacterium]